MYYIDDISKVYSFEVGLKKEIKLYEKGINYWCDWTRRLVLS